MYLKRYNKDIRYDEISIWRQNIHGKYIFKRKNESITKNIINNIYIISGDEKNKNEHRVMEMHKILEKARID